MTAYTAACLVHLINTSGAICVFTVETTNGSSEFESGDFVSTVTRVMVSQNRLWSDSEEVVALQVFSEVIEMEGRKVGMADGGNDPFNELILVLSLTSMGCCL